MTGAVGLLPPFCILLLGIFPQAVLLFPPFWDRFISLRGVPLRRACLTSPFLLSCLFYPVNYDLVRFDLAALFDFVRVGGFAFTLLRTLLISPRYPTVSFGLGPSFRVCPFRPFPAVVGPRSQRSVEGLLVLCSSLPSTSSSPLSCLLARFF